MSRSTIYDFHHSYYFHQIDSSYPTKLLLFAYNDSFIALPVVIRPIEGTSYFDITSVYGYAGPIYHFEDGSDRSKLTGYFQQEFLDFCRRENIVSVFVRLNPFITEQKNILRGLGETVDLNKTVAIDLTLPADRQRRGYRKSLKSELNQLRKKDIVIQEAKTTEEIDRFIAIYYETMDRVHATPHYYFPKAYFHKFLNNQDFNSRLLLAFKDEHVIAGALFTFTKKMMQYHLAGTTEEYIGVAPMKLILDEARLIGNELSVETLHLGGGIGGRDDDSLFRFKSGFSKDFKQFSIWKFTVNEALYAELSEEKEGSFFPLYRV